jgi:hypothetical protein
VVVIVGGVSDVVGDVGVDEETGTEVVVATCVKVVVKEGVLVVLVLVQPNVEYKTNDNKKHMVMRGFRVFNLARSYFQFVTKISDTMKTNNTLLIEFINIRHTSRFLPLYEYMFNKGLSLPISINARKNP